MKVLIVALALLFAGCASAAAQHWTYQPDGSVTWRKTYPPLGWESAPDICTGSVSQFCDRIKRGEEIRR